MEALNYARQAVAMEPNNLQYRQFSEFLILCGAELPESSAYVWRDGRRPLRLLSEVVVCGFSVRVYGRRHVYMLLSTRQMAYLGLLLAICEVFLYMSASPIYQYVSAIIFGIMLCRDSLYFDICRQGRGFLSGIADPGILSDSQSSIFVDICRVKYLYSDPGRVTASDADEISGVERMGGEAGIL